VCHPPQHFHRHHLIGGDVGVLEDGRQSYWLGATSLCRVFTGTPTQSYFPSCMNASTRSGIAPVY
jgi:hypothetical protein